MEAALTTEPDNEELIQLKQDLSQVIELTSQLINPAGSSEQVPEKQNYEVSIIRYNLFLSLISFFLGVGN